ncbi:hypothetical protein B0H98_10346 [Vreelandella songnenensis]|uniref:Lipoprotein n=1 Tax=Vreelandella songnenensis TaxID=1176243 RepID=A0A2T0V4J9_9GAMM|nr:hypothetical protein [Halomonas songnenensis]PRY65106.1 hypothetical protein B0H98_10346 [Halomonas songnenensis]
MLKIVLALSATILISGCSQESSTATSNEPASDTSAEQSAPHQMTDHWIGRWVGVEGLVLEIRHKDSAGPGNYLLEMQYGLDADQRGTFEGQATDEGIRFTREDGEQLLREADGEATGLKWLADKEDCLVVHPGEGYCRD